MTTDTRNATIALAQAVLEALDALQLPGGATWYMGPAVGPACMLRDALLGVSLELSALADALEEGGRQGQGLLRRCAAGVVSTQKTAGQVRQAIRRSVRRIIREA